MKTFLLATAILQSTLIFSQTGIGTTRPTAKVEINSGTANTSGLKFSNLNAATPVSTGTTLGVNARGNVVTVNGAAFIPAFEEVVPAVVI